jgi:hypothetical protein
VRLLLWPSVALALLWPAHLWAQWAFHAYGGASFSRPADIRVVGPAVATDLVLRGVPWRNEPLEDPPYYSFTLSYAPQGLAVFAVEFTHLKVFARTDARVPVSGVRAGAPVAGVEPVGDTFRRLSVSHGVNLVTVNAGACWSLRPRVAVLALAGIGLSLSHPETDWSAGRDEHYEWDGPAVQVRAEVRWRGGRWWGLGAGYRWSRVALDDRIPGGRVRLDLATHHVFAGAGLLL